LFGIHSVLTGALAVFDMQTDISLVAKLWAALDKLDCVSHGCGLVINVGKTKVMVGKEAHVC